MFISKAEKEDLFYRIGVLEKTVIFLENKLVKLSASKPEATARKGRDWSPEQRAKASEQMKQFWKNKQEPKK